MHEVLHVAILASVLLGAASASVLVLWPLLAESPLPRPTKGVLVGLLLTGVGLLIVEWLFVH